jgi:hypothetical protein
LNAQRNWSKTQLNSTSSVNTARFHKNGVTQSQTFNPTTNSARWQKNNNARVTNTTNVNGAKWQKFNNNTNVTVNNNSNNRFRRFNNLTVNSNIPRVTFHQGNRINAARNWNGVQYSAFRNYQASWHDRDWWRGHNSRIIFALGGWYYWNDGFWCPAYGYDRSSVYYWDGPIYGYNDLPPDQVVANVQSSLQAQGYYQGAIDGILGPQTRAAVASYQQDHGLLVTSAIDQPTVEALGFS